MHKLSDLLHCGEVLYGCAARTDLLLCLTGTDGQQATDTSSIVTGNQIPGQEGLEVWREGRGGGGREQN